MEHTKKGRNRKIFKQGIAHIFFTGESVTATAGMALVSRAFESLHITGQLESATSDLDWDKHCPTHELLQQLITLRILGKSKVLTPVTILINQGETAITPF